MGCRENGSSKIQTLSTLIVSSTLRRRRLRRFRFRSAGTSFFVFVWVVQFTGTDCMAGAAIRCLLYRAQPAAAWQDFFWWRGRLRRKIAKHLEPYSRSPPGHLYRRDPHESVRATSGWPPNSRFAHVPILCGTPFFVSPTKLLSYIAMGKRLSLVPWTKSGQVLEHGKQ